MPNHFLTTFPFINLQARIKQKVNTHAPGSMTPATGQSVTGFHSGKFSNITGSTGRNVNIWSGTGRWPM